MKLKKRLYILLTTDLGRFNDSSRDYRQGYFMPSKILLPSFQGPSWIVITFAKYHGIIEVFLVSISNFFRSFVVIIT